VRRIIILLFSVFYLSAFNSYGQLNQSAFIVNPDIKSADSNKFYISVVNKNIIKNNEYYNYIVPGYTLLGSQLNLQLKYYPSYNTMIETGVHLLYYYGRDKLDRVLPMIRFTYKPVKGLFVTIGDIYGGLYHNYLDPMYNFENVIQLPPELGFQVVYNNKWVHADIFLNWIYFLMPDDISHKEKFSVGITGYTHILNPKHRFNIKVPFQYFTLHSGGQIDTLSTPLSTIVNMDFGLMSGYSFNGFVNKIGVNGYYLLFKDNSSEKTLAFESGHGWMADVYTVTKWVDMHLGYWKGYQFFAPLGDPVFSSISYKSENKDEAYANREMFYYKVFLHHIIAKGINIGFRFEGYVELIGDIEKPLQGNNDYSYSVFMTFNRDFFITKIKNIKK
jgi:hypothetical protein